MYVYSSKLSGLNFDSNGEIRLCFLLNNYSHGI